MKQYYPNLINFLNYKYALSSLCFSLLATLLLIPAPNANAQEVYTLGEGTMSSGTLGVSPFAMVNTDQRSQYLYYGPELQAFDAVEGYVTAFALNITDLASPADLFPTNVTIKMGLTTIPVLGTTMETGLQVVYTASSESITELGWHTIVLDTPFLWDGSQHIIVEICRDNITTGSNFEVEAEIYGLGDYRTVGLYENEGTTAGCDLTGTTQMSNGNRRTRPNAQFTLTQICDGVPNAGTTEVGAGPYCDGTTFDLTVEGSDIASGISYQWQSSPQSAGPWSDINGATDPSYSAMQTTATYYRRVTRCDNTNDAANSTPVLVNGPGCYCEAPTQTANPVGITQVTFSTINNFSTSNNTYSYYNTNAEVEQTMSYNLAVKVNTAGGTNYTTAWIDWNSNGNFEISESYNLGTVTGGSNVNSGISPTITVPADAVAGATQMRIRTQQSPQNEGPNACGDIVTGETEDYSLMIEEFLGLNDNLNAAASLLVYGNSNGLIVKMNSENIQQVAVYDISGRLLANKQNVNESQIIMPEFQGLNNILIVRVTTAAGAVITKKVIL